MTCCPRCASETPPLTVFCPQCQQPNEPDFRLLINRIFDGRFQLYRELGEGGLSTVFAAIDLSNDNTVVVKVSDPRHLAQTTFNSAAELTEARQYWAEMIERMRHEVAALTGIKHKNIVQVYATGAISEDLRYVVMELLRGKTLREELNKRRRLPAAECAALAAEVAAGLSLIHARGIVHRDLTPRNIFLCEENLDFGLPLSDSVGKQGFPTTDHYTQPKTVKLIDFGIAKFPKPPGTQTYTQHAVMAGTPGYASPEQAQNLMVDHRADIYSLGVVLYEMVTGEKPFTGRTATEIALKQLRGEPTRPREFVPDLPIRLEALILRALAKDPAARQQSIEELAAELKAISTRIEVPLSAPIIPLHKLAPNSEPSGTEVYNLLSNVVAKTEEPISTLEAAQHREPVQGRESDFNLIPASSYPRRVFFATAAIIGLFLTGLWIFAQPNFSALQSALPQISAPQQVSSSASPTPTIRPDVTTSRTGSHSFPARQPKVEEIVPLEKPVPIANPAPTKTISIKSAAPAPRKAVTPAPEIAVLRYPQPRKMPELSPLPPVSLPKAEPTPSPAPPPQRPAANENNSGWKREPAQTPPPRDNEVRRVERLPEPRVISWQGKVYGVREISLEMPGVPGMIDIPRNFHKKVGVIEPPSPGNGWRRAVLRVFGDGDVSLIIRWLPNRNAGSGRQELVQGPVLAH